MSARVLSRQVESGLWLYSLFPWRILLCLAQTGRMRTRNLAHQEANRAGFTPHPSVSAHFPYLLSSHPVSLCSERGHRRCIVLFDALVSHSVRSHPEGINVLRGPSSGAETARGGAVLSMMPGEILASSKGSTKHRMRFVRSRVVSAKHVGPLLGHARGLFVVCLSSLQRWICAPDGSAPSSSVQFSQDVI